MSIKFLLRDILSERGISERQFANQIGIREGTLYDICNNLTKRVSIENIEKICKELNLQPGDWIKWEE